jgi:hypothetical protein
VPAFPRNAKTGIEFWTMLDGGESIGTPAFAMKDQLYRQVDRHGQSVFLANRSA